jgi:predicted RNA-binding protein with PUA-like domain
VTLDEIKSDPAFKGFDLLRIGRLSVVPVPDKMWERIIELSNKSTG